MKTVYTSGTFDLFHIGHLNILRRSKALGDRLVVGVSTDELVASYKKSKPIIPFEDRIAIIESLKDVDQAIRQDELFSQKLMTELDVDIMTIGDDWKDKHHPGMEWVKAHPKIKMVFLPYTQTVSSTRIKTMIKEDWQADRSCV